jgi:hypothetical protein
MLDADLIAKCTDPALTPAIVEQFVEKAGSLDPLAITVKSGGRLILVRKPKTPDEAMDIVRDHVGGAVVRVGLTQFPASVGINDASELKAGIVDPCENLCMGTRMFAKIMRIVAKWYGNPTSKEVLPQIIEDAVYSWKTGEFEGVDVFQAEDPGTAWKVPTAATSVSRDGEETDTGDTPLRDETENQTDALPEAKEPQPEGDAEGAGIRIDMSRVGGQK